MFETLALNLRQLTLGSGAAPQAQSPGTICYAYTISLFYQACLATMDLKKVVIKVFISHSFIFFIAYNNIVFAFENSDFDPMIKGENTTLCTDILIEQCCINAMNEHISTDQNVFKIQMMLASLGEYIGIMLGSYHMIAYTHAHTNVKIIIKTLLLTSLRSFSVMQANAILPDVKDAKYQYLFMNFITKDRSPTAGSSVDPPEVDGRSTEVENLATTVLYPALEKLLDENIFIIDLTSVCLVSLIGGYLGAIVGYYSGYLAGEFLVLFLNGLMVLFY